MPRMTDARRAEILEHIDTIRGTWRYLTDETLGEKAQGDKPMLYPQAVWLADHLEGILRDHVAVEPSLTPADEAPKRSIRDRLRALVGMAKGRPDSR